ncbi:hypothetical protein GQ53DRAFT_838128 [Thozetella sp. PMI_491]|nr:hypothetical protein GQ53DRAFT_838128 [Thozetella sp. PMI_491]
MPDQPHFTFVAVDHLGKTSTSGRTLARKHVMNGKNRKIGVDQGSPRPFSSGKAGSSSTLPSEGGDKTVNFEEGTRLTARRNKPRTKHWGMKHHTMTIPKTPVYWVTGLLPAAYEISDEYRRLIYDVCTLPNSNFWPFKLGVEIAPPNKTEMLSWLSKDDAYLHSVLFLIISAYDITAQRLLSRAASYHLYRAVQFMQDRVSSNIFSIDDSTIYAVTNLVFSACVSQDLRAATAHAAGVRKMVRLRGGIERLRDNPELYMRLCRVDFAYYLHTGNEPVFFIDPANWPTTETEDPEDPGDLYRALKHCSLDLPSAVGAISNRSLLGVLQDLRTFAHLINVPDTKRATVSYGQFTNILCSVQFRLIELDGNLNDTLAECLRLVLLALLTTTFTIPGSETRYPFLARRLTECIDLVNVSSPENQNQQLMMWVLIIHAISLTGIDNAWMTQKWRSYVSRDLTWTEARERLKEILWVDFIHDKLGEYAFEMLQGRGGPSLGTQTALWTCGWGICPFKF